MDNLNRTGPATTTGGPDHRCTARRRRPAFTLALALVLPLMAAAQSVAEDAAMNAAFEKARATLPQFIVTLDTKPAGTARYEVKIRVSESGQSEYFWVGNLERDGERFTGTLNDTPRVVRSVRQGQSMTFVRREIYDWTYYDERQKRTVGNYTGCAQLAHESAEAAAAFKRQNNLQCE